jgi:hypothetical protein
MQSFPVSPSMWWAEHHIGHMTGLGRLRPFTSQPPFFNPYKKRGF